MEITCAGRGRTWPRLSVTRSGRNTVYQHFIAPTAVLRVLTAVFLGLSVEIVVPLDAVKELLSALRVSDVLHTDVYSLLDVTVTNDLVDDNTDGVGGDIVDDTGTATLHHDPLAFLVVKCPSANIPVVVLVRHTLLLGRIRLDVDDISNAVGNQVGRQLNRTVFCVLLLVQPPLPKPQSIRRTLEATLEHVARTRAVTE